MLRIIDMLQLTYCNQNRFALECTLVIRNVERIQLLAFSFPWSLRSWTFLATFLFRCLNHLMEFSTSLFVVVCLKGLVIFSRHHSKLLLWFEHFCFSDVSLFFTRFEHGDFWPIDLNLIIGQSLAWKDLAFERSFVFDRSFMPRCAIGTVVTRSCLQPVDIFLFSRFIVSTKPDWLRF